MAPSVQPTTLLPTTAATAVATRLTNTAIPSATEASQPTSSAGPIVPTKVIVQPTAEITPEATATTIEPPYTTKSVPAVCTDRPSIYELQNTLGMTEIAGLEFVDSDTLLIEGWTPRGFSDASNDLYAPRYSFSEVLVDIASGQLTELPSRIEPSYQSPCTTAQCKTQIVDESPDRNWQLMTAGGVPNEVGVWLVGPDTMTRLVEDVPSSLKWTWAADNSLIWLSFSMPEYGPSPPGSHFLAAELGETVSVVDSEALSQNYSVPLYMPSYTAAFSPAENKIISKALNEYFERDDDRFFTFDASTMPPNQIATNGPVAGLKTVVWDRTIGSFLLIVLSESGMEIQQVDGTPLLEIPLSTFALFLPNGDALLKEQTTLKGLVPIDNYTMSPNGQSLAIGYSGRVVVFGCINQE